jgi:hypothetical protein
VGVHTRAAHVRWNDGAWTVLMDESGDDCPWGVRTSALPGGIEAGTVVRAGSAGISVGDVGFRSSRRSHPCSRPRRNHRQAWHRLAARVLPYQGELSTLDRRVHSRFAEVLTGPAADAEDLVARCAPVVGAGTGLTPFGDDLVVGALAAHWATGGEVGTVGGVDGTTDLSGWILMLATGGRFTGALTALSHAVDVPGRRHREAAVLRLVGIGASSGIGMALGFVHGLSVQAGEATDAH